MDSKVMYLYLEIYQKRFIKRMMDNFDNLLHFNIESTILQFKTII